MHQFWKDLVATGIVKKTRKIGRAELFMLNKESPLVKKLIDIDFEISKMFVEKEIKGRAQVLA